MNMNRNISTEEVEVCASIFQKAFIVILALLASSSSIVHLVSSEDFNDPYGKILTVLFATLGSIGLILYVFANKVKINSIEIVSKTLLSQKKVVLDDVSKITLQQIRRGGSGCCTWR